MPIAARFRIAPGVAATNQRNWHVSQRLTFLTQSYRNAGNILQDGKYGFGILDGSWNALSLGWQIFADRPDFSLSNADRKIRILEYQIDDHTMQGRAERHRSTSRCWACCRRFKFQKRGKISAFWKIFRNFAPRLSEKNDIRTNICE
jgi:hypothetical protein